MMTDKPINEPTPESDVEAFDYDAKFWGRLRRHYDTVWPGWDIFAAGGATVLAAILIQLMIPIKYMAGMVQWSILPMIGIAALFIVISFMGIAAFAFVDDEYTLWLGLDVPDAYSGILFTFQWNAVMGIATIISGCFVYLASYAVCWPYLIFLFLFFYTTLSTLTLIGELTWYGMSKYSHLNMVREMEKEEKTE